MQTQAPKITDYNEILTTEQFSIEKIWLLLASTWLTGVHPASVQYIEMRKAFYIGVSECFKIMSDYASNLPEAQAMKVMDKIYAETNAFVKAELAKCKI